MVEIALRLGKLEVIPPGRTASRPLAIISVLRFWWRLSSEFTGVLTTKPPHTGTLINPGPGFTRRGEAYGWSIHRDRHTYTLILTHSLAFTLCLPLAPTYTVIHKHTNSTHILSPPKNTRTHTHTAALLWKYTTPSPSCLGASLARVTDGLAVKGLLLDLFNPRVQTSISPRMYLADCPPFPCQCKEQLNCWGLAGGFESRRNRWFC